MEVEPPKKAAIRMRKSPKARTQKTNPIIFKTPIKVPCHGRAIFEDRVVV